MSLKSSTLTSVGVDVEDVAREEEAEGEELVVEVEEEVEREHGGSSGMLKVFHIRSPSAGIGGAVHGPPDL